MKTVSLHQPQNGELFQGQLRRKRALEKYSTKFFQFCEKALYKKSSIVFNLSYLIPQTIQKKSQIYQILFYQP